MKRYNSSKNKKTPPTKEVVDYFPRGNTSKEDFSFNTAMLDHSKTFLQKKRKGKSKEQKGDTSTDIKIDEGEVSRAIMPRFKMGDLVLLCISEIRKDYMIANYGRNKKAMIHSTYTGLDHTSEDFSLLKYFKIGQFINGAVLSKGNNIHLNNGNINQKIPVTIDPALVNTGMKPEKITEGMDLYGQLVLEENNKYTADFKFTKNKSEEIEDIDVDSEDSSNIKKDYNVILKDSDMIIPTKIVGSYYFFRVTEVSFDKKSKQYNITVTLNVDSYKFGVKSIDFQYIRPGFLFKANVTRDLANGKEVSFGGNIGSMFIDHVKDEQKTKNIMVRVVHVATSKKTCSLSSLSHIKNLNVEDIDNKEQLIGKKFEKGKIVKLLYGKSFLVSIEDGDKSFNAFLHNNNVKFENEPKEGDEIKSPITIKEYNFFDDIPICTAIESSSLLTWDTLKVGQFLNGTITSITKHDLMIKINTFIEGKLPLEHITDYPLTKIPKKYKVNQSIPVRVFAIDPHTKFLLLTSKETLMDETTQLYSDINELDEGIDVFVVYLGNGLFSHSNSIIGTLRQFKRNSNEYKIGKLYKFKIYKIDLKKKKIIFTKENEVFVYGVGDYEGIVRRNHLIGSIAKTFNTYSEYDNLNEGDVRTFEICDIEEMMKTMMNKGIDQKLIEENKTTFETEMKCVKLSIENNDGNYIAFIQKEMLSDYQSEEIFKAVKSHESYEMLILYHDKENKIMFLTMKKSLIAHRASMLHIDETKKTIKEQNFENDKLYYGYVNSVLQKGVRVEFFGKKKILMKQYNDYNREYKPGQCVICKFIYNKFFFDVKAYQAYTEEDYINESNDYLSNVLKDMNLMNKSTKSNKKVPSKNVDIEIVEIKNDFILGKYKDTDVMIPSCLYNYSLKESKGSFDMKKINAKLIRFEGNAYIAEMPKEIIARIKANVPSVSSRNIGDTISIRVNGIKGKYLYSVIDKHSVCRIDADHFNVDRIKLLLSEQKDSRRKSSIESNSSVNKELKIKGMIVNITDSNKNYKLYDLSPIDENSIEDDSLLSTSIDTTGSNENIGIIAAIKKTSKNPIALSIKSNLNTKLQVAFSDIPLDKVSTHGEIDYHIGHKVSFYCDKEYKCTFVPSSEVKPVTIEIGKVYICRILKAIDGKGFIVDINAGKEIETFVDICEIADEAVANPLKTFEIGSIAKCRIISLNSKANRYMASLRSSIVNDDDYEVITKGSTLSFAQKFGDKVKYDLRNKIMKFGIANGVELNSLAMGYVSSSSEKGVFIKIANDVIVRASMRELTDENAVSKPYLLYSVNSIVLCRVISIYKNEKDQSDIKINVSLRESVIKYALTMKKKDIKVNNFFNVIVVNSNKKGYECNIIGSTFNGLLKSKNIKNNTNIKVGEIIVAEIVKCDVTNNTNSKIRFSTMNIDDSFDKKLIINQVDNALIEKAKENEVIYHNIIEIVETAKKESDTKEIEDITNVNNGNEIDFEEIVANAAKNRKMSLDSRKSNHSKVEDEEEDEDVIEDKEDEEIKDDTIAFEKNEKIRLLSGVGATDEDENAMEIDEENKEDNSDEEETKKDLTSSKARDKNKIDTELKIREIESKTEEEKSVPYYEKLILSDKNKAISWVEYASYILDTLNVESARKIFKRAIEAIDITNTKEKLSIYVAFMNFENIYGDTESFKQIVEAALEKNDKKKVYSHLIVIYNSSKKYQMANEIYKILVKEYFNDVDIWKKYIDFAVETQIEDGKEVLGKAMQVLNKKNHLEVTMSYAMSLYKAKECEKARDVFDSILKSLPKRKDIWFVYCDKECKFGSVDKARKIYERMIEVPFKKNALKSVIKKYLEFEKDNMKSEKDFNKAKEKAQKIIQERMEIDDEEEDNQDE